MWEKDLINKYLEWEERIKLRNAYECEERIELIDV